jgi:cystathionine beta-lyase
VAAPAPWPAPDDDGFSYLPLEWLRAKTGVKWSESAPDELACWVADMDFPTPPAARAALVDMAAAADFGYQDEASTALGPVWRDRMAHRFGWAPGPAPVRAFTDLNQALQALLYVTTSPGDGVVLLTPAYSAFVAALADMDRRLLAVPAVDGGGRWSFDMEAARSAARSARAMVVVNPHNPTGRALTRAELSILGELAVEHDLPVISDEVHADLVLVADARHVPFASLSPELAARTITLYSASKSYNLGGMRCALAHMGADAVEAALAALPPALLGQVSMAAVATTLACWSPEGNRWLERCADRLRSNRAAIGQWLDGPGAELGIKGNLPEATYLQWLDFGATRLAADPAGRLRAAGARLAPGRDFGPGGETFARLNFATSPGVLEDILGRTAAACRLA